MKLVHDKYVSENSKEAFSSSQLSVKNLRHVCMNWPAMVLPFIMHFQWSAKNFGSEI